MRHLLIFFAIVAPRAQKMQGLRSGVLAHEVIIEPLVGLSSVERCRKGGASPGRYRVHRISPVRKLTSMHGVP
jgi:hypothetical protein